MKPPDLCDPGTPFSPRVWGSDGGGGPRAVEGDAPQPGLTTLWPGLDSIPVQGVGTVPTTRGGRGTAGVGAGVRAGVGSPSWVMK